MLTKLLITALIITGAFVFIRFKNKTALSSHSIRTINVEPVPDKSSLKNAKFAAITILSLTLLTGSIMMFLSWQDERRVFDIKIINPQTGSSDHYQAHKKDLKGRSFTTITGQVITVSELERLEFQEIDP